MASGRTLLSNPDSPSFLEELYTGKLRWDLLDPFPAQDAEDRAAGDRVLAEITRFMTEWIDPESVDAGAELPPGFLQKLRKRGLCKLGAGSEVGGWGLSPRNVFRVISEVAGRSLAVALILAIDNAIGISAYLPHLPEGPLRDFVRERVVRGSLSCTADTEPHGAANTSRRTVAVPTDDGEAYLITGQKVFVGNAPVADVVIISATVTEDGTEARRLFFVDTDTPGLKVHAEHEFMGLKGFPNGGFTFDGMRVPRAQMLTEPAYSGRMTATSTLATLLGRNYLIAAPSLAFARLGTAWATDFAARRSVDGRVLGEYDEVQRLLASIAADTFAIDTLTTWTMVQPDLDGPVNTAFEQLAVKNISSVAAWRVLDRTMSLLAAEGFETGPSKARRGAVPVPLERAVRDARGLRISGGVDFQLDFWAGRTILPTYYPEPRPAADLDAPVDLNGLRTGKLSERNTEHARYATRQAKDLARFLLRLRERHASAEELLARERIVISVNQIVNEILTMAVVLARAATLAESGHASGQDLADVFCADARRRIADSWAAAGHAESGDEPDHTAVSALLTDATLPPGVFHDTCTATRSGSAEGDAQ
ncbi:acyl-CoA dehydrogenase [Streptomyces europaeiscabiei]|uniref:acyl-CoA dehydrogenase family protein n=1 Tax=Streptomyces europaeiscabiei TaxID=146819 RepID=UPI0029BB3DA9|nr:acyl-CoA dehydrogenase [Streptomyces europaeiscabiei]MDX3696408.1 acyl-CoA dehydrogenase [Streptomyces europaeiscabiei]